MISQVLLSIFRSLTDFFIIVGVPSTRFFDDIQISRNLNQLTCLRNAFSVHDFYKGFLEWRSNLIFNNLDLGFFTNIGILLITSSLDLSIATDIQTDRSIELQCTATWCCFRITKHNANFFTQLVNENRNRLRFVDRSRQLAHSLAHHPSLQADMAVTNIAIDFRTRYQGCNGVHNHQVYRT